MKKSVKQITHNNHKKYTSGLAILTVLISLHLSSCYNRKGDMREEHSSDPVATYYKNRLANLFRIAAIDNLSKKLNHFEIIILRKNKCAVCNSSIYEHVELYSQPRQTKLIILAVTDTPADWKKEFRNYPNAQQTEIVEVNGEEAEKLGFDVVETMHVTILKKEVLSYQVL